MAITIGKKLTVQDLMAQPEAPASDLALRADKVGKLMESVKAAEDALAVKVKVELTRLAELKLKLKEEETALVDKANEELAESEVSADEERIIVGKKYQLKISKQGTSRSIRDLSMVKALMDDSNPELFMQVATVTLKAIDDYLTPEERKVVLDTTRGSRTVKVTKRN